MSWTTFAGLVIGDDLLVNGDAYGGDWLEWAPLRSVAAGSAAIYPYRVELSNGATGQYAGYEIRGWRRKLALHQALVEMELRHPGFFAEVEENAKWPR